MPRMTTNEDGSTTFSIDSTELGKLKPVLDRSVRDLHRVLEFVDSADFRKAVGFVKSIVS